MKSVFAIVILILMGCAPTDGPHKPVSAAKATATGGGTPGYDTVKPIFQKYCSSCHPGQQANNWLDYAQAKANATNIKLRVWTMKTAPNRMPKAGSPESSAIPDSDRQTIAAWVDGGALEKGGSASAGGQGGPAPTAQAGKLQACFSCHGDGARGNPATAVPALAGQRADYLFNQLSAFQLNTRKDPTGAMNGQMADKSEAEMREYAEALSKLPGFYDGKAPLEIKDPERYMAGKTIAVENGTCIGCHGQTDPEGEIPFLSGQGKTYLMRQLVAFREKTRKNETMNDFASSLSDENIKELATFFSQTPLAR